MQAPLSTASQFTVTVDWPYAPDGEEFQRVNCTTDHVKGSLDDVVNGLASLVVGQAPVIVEVRRVS